MHIESGGDGVREKHEVHGHELANQRLFGSSASFQFRTDMKWKELRKSVCCVIVQNDDG